MASGNEQSNKHIGILKDETFSFIAVDDFTKNVVQKASVLFLTHYHSDHYRGLQSQYDAKEVGRIFRENPEKLFYCSDITKRIFESDRGKTCFIPEKQIISQPVGQPFSIFGRRRKDNEEIIVTVTFVPSGHILGAVMILFEHERERVLFTGDFRIHPQDINKIRALHDCDGYMKTITHLYLDTTFASVKYTSFPLRSEVSKFVADIAFKYISLSPRNQIHLNLPYTFAYEKLIIDISKHLKCKVMVPRDTYDKYYRYIPELDAAVCPKTFEENSSQIHACISFGYISRTNILNSCEFCPLEKCCVWLIRPSAQFFSNDKKDYKSIFEECNKSDMIRVPYSAHCSLEELQAFVNYVGPNKITTIVKDDEDFKNNILSLIKPPKMSEVDISCDEASENSSLFFDSSDSDNSNCDIDDSSSESPS